MSFDGDCSFSSGSDDASSNDCDFDVSKYLRLDHDWNAALDDDDAASLSSECERQDAMRCRRRKITRVVCEIVLSTCALVLDMYKYTRGGLQNMRAYAIPDIKFDPDAYYRC